MIKDIKNTYKEGLGGRIIFIVIAAVLMGFLFISSPDIKFPLMFYKMSMVTIGSILGYFLDVALFPNFRPKDIAQDIEDMEVQGKESELHAEHIEGLYRLAFAANIRRAIVVSASVIAICAGL